MTELLPDAELAVLSACQSATRDEGVHLAAAMLNAGYKSPIETMWSISDTVNKRFYEDSREQMAKGGEL